LASDSVFSGLISQSVIGCGTAAKAWSVGAKTVKGAVSPSVSARPAAVRAAASLVRSVDLAETSAASPPAVDVASAEAASSAAATGEKAKAPRTRRGVAKNFARCIVYSPVG
jgi:hypothetical protein